MRKAPTSVAVRLNLPLAARALRARGDGTGAGHGEGAFCRRPRSSLATARDQVGRHDRAPRPQHMGDVRGVAGQAGPTHPVHVLAGEAQHRRDLDGQEIGEQPRDGGRRLAGTDELAPRGGVRSAAAPDRRSAPLPACSCCRSRTRRWGRSPRGRCSRTAGRATARRAAPPSCRTGREFSAFAVARSPAAPRSHGSAEPCNRAKMPRCRRTAASTDSPAIRSLPRKPKVAS